MLGLPVIAKNQIRWQTQRWWCEMPLIFFFLEDSKDAPRVGPFRTGEPQQGMILASCDGELGYLDTMLVLTGEEGNMKTLRWWMGFDVPCCAKHQDRTVRLRVKRVARPLIRKGALLSPALPANILQVHPQCPACTRLLLARLAQHRFGSLAL